MTTQMYQWGIINDGQRRQCHRPVLTICPPRLESHFEQVACGTNFTLVLHSPTHRVLVVGDEPKYGRLGLGDEQSIATSLTFIRGDLPAIGFISCGPATSVLLTRDQREVWAFGKGIGPTSKAIYRSEEPITHCACNENSILLVLNARSLVERRFNRSGFTTDWTRVYHSNDRIRHFDFGSALHGFVTEEGHIFLWGTNVPTGPPASEEHFRQVSITAPLQRDLIDDRPVHISCSRGQFHSHALVLTEQGSIYSMGSNYKCKLGLDKSLLFTGQWTLIELSLPCSFRKLAAGGIHSSALTNDGRVFTWGCGSDGRLGHGESEGHRYLYKESEPRSVETLSQFETVDLATSYYHMAAIVSARRKESTPVE